MIALVLGGAPTWDAEAQAAAALLNRRHIVVAANLAGIHWRGRLDGWASLHPDHLPEWAAERPGKPAARLFTPPATSERWPGSSSGLYALQCALFELGATAAILCGVPMDSEAGHFVHRGAWAGTDDYRRGFVAALHECGGRIRSCGGWTAELFGRPTAAWVGASDNIKPLGATAPRRSPMHHVKNTGNTTQKFWARDQRSGLMRLHRLAPGATVDAEIDAAQPRFNGGDLKVTEAADASRKPSAKDTASDKA